ncbi:MAG: hypothetical protein ACOY93_00930 [Bacillota bacterium]
MGQREGGVARRYGRTQVDPRAGRGRGVGEACGTAGKQESQEGESGDPVW